MEVRRLSLDGVAEFTPKKFGDARGFFSETWSREQFRQAGFAQDWVQDNQSFSAERNVLRGLHFRGLRGIDIAAPVHANEKTRRIRRRRGIEQRLQELVIG